ncbi:hypothetical protein F383_07311 [Gossypium arboreum]|uniref:Uncharacterized protein n=1 Tax=Gossypium arboreum TaxID=29729 RepID=A0A0B0PHG1_GOSAR|nr:hypothetical protein F383_07311 [Gossypium arboreum]
MIFPLLIRVDFAFPKIQLQNSTSPSLHFPLYFTNY